MDFTHVLEQLLDRFREENVDCALIGGFALAVLGVPRATVDLDFLVPGDRADRIAEIMRDLGYRELHRSADAANYSGGSKRLGRVDFLFARRRYTNAMLARAGRRSIAAAGEVRVLDAEDIIGLKIQSSSNDPKRLSLDLADIERLLTAHPSLDLERVREYFRIFGRETELDELLARIR